MRLEYENLFALGPLCGIDDPDIVLAGVADSAMNWALTRSAPAARSPLRWNVPNAA